MKIVCDTNVLVRAAINPNGLAAELLKHIRGAHVLAASHPLLTELLVVLRRPKIRAIHGRDEQGIRRLVSSFYKMATIVRLPQSLPRVVPHDLRDDPILFPAVGAATNVLTTRDQHFFDSSVMAFAASHGIRILRDDELLQELLAQP